MSCPESSNLNYKVKRSKKQQQYLNIKVITKLAKFIVQKGPTNKKQSFPLHVLIVNENRIAILWGFAHIYKKKNLFNEKLSFLCNGLHFCDSSVILKSRKVFS